MSHRRRGLLAVAGAIAAFGFSVLGGGGRPRPGGPGAETPLERINALVQPRAVPQLRPALRAVLPVHRLRGEPRRLHRDGRALRGPRGGQAGLLPDRCSVGRRQRLLPRHDAHARADRGVAGLPGRDDDQGQPRRPGDPGRRGGGCLGDPDRGGAPRPRRTASRAAPTASRSSPWSWARSGWSWWPAAWAGCSWCARAGPADARPCRRRAHRSRRGWCRPRSGWSRRPAAWCPRGTGSSRPRADPRPRTRRPRTSRSSAATAVPTATPVRTSARSAGSPWCTEPPTRRPATDRSRFGPAHPRR